MLPLATNWTTVSSLATGAGTLVLAIATFASVRTSNRSARVAELALQEQRRPVLTQSRLEDPLQKIMFLEGHWVHAAGSRGVAEHTDGSIYLAMSLRNVGAGIGVCQAWAVTVGPQADRVSTAHTPEDQFRLQTRDLYVPAGDIGVWQGALRDHNDPGYQHVAEAIAAGEAISIELLYSDQVGSQRTISRFGLTALPGNDERFVSITRHWYLDRDGPRSEEQVDAAVQAMLRAQVDGRAAIEAEAAAATAAQADGTARPGDGSADAELAERGAGTRPG